MMLNTLLSHFIYVFFNIPCGNEWIREFGLTYSLISYLYPIETQVKKKLKVPKHSRELKQVQDKWERVSVTFCSEELWHMVKDFFKVYSLIKGFLPK